MAFCSAVGTYLCANDIGGLILMNDCFLLYDNYNFISILDANLYVYLWNPSNVSGNMNDFQATTSIHLSNLSNVAYDPANRRSAYYSMTQNFYGFAQFGRYLSIEDCRAFLVKAGNTMEDCCSVDPGCSALLGSCVVRFESCPFFDTTRLSSPEASPGTPTTYSPSTKGRTQSKRRHGYSSELGLLIHEQQHFIMSLEASAEAPQNFHENKKLGEGGFGPVYREGTTRERMEVAVKKLSARSTQGKKEFMNEVKLTGNVQHRNLVKPLGCCAEGDERLLVHQCFPNKRLETSLFDPEKRRQLDWQKRYHIIIGISQYLLYLHEGLQLRIIHRDIKVNNSSSCMAPEYAMPGQLSVKAHAIALACYWLRL